MQNDEVIWQVLRHKHCSFMTKITAGIFCRNPYNLTGVCNRSSCPLANSRYATIRDHDGVFYLYMKTIERAHMPNKLWERVKLPRNYEKALEIIDNNLMYWPKFLVHKAKQRLTKMTQMRIRMRKLALKTREKVMTVPTKEKKREARREEKAQTAAVLEKNIEKELVERVKKGMYGDLYNYHTEAFEKMIQSFEELETDVNEDWKQEIEFVEGDFEDEEDIEDLSGHPAEETGSDNDDDDVDDDDDDDDDDDAEEVAMGRKRGRPDSKYALKKKEREAKRKKGRALVEVEHEVSDRRQKATNDEVIWQVLRHKHCSYMTKITAGIFCQNPYNLTGVCNRSSCPLANSRYATIRDHDGVFYLYMKTIERAHMPNKLWERVKLPRNYEQALAIIDKNLMHWPKFLVHKAKQRLTKMTQMRIRMRKLALKTREKVMTVPTKERKREARREEKAQTAAILDKNIEKELLARLKNNVYDDDIYNVHAEAFKNLLDSFDQLEMDVNEDDAEGDIEYVQGDFEQDEEDIEDFGGHPAEETGSDDDDEGDDEDAEEVAMNRKRGRPDSKYALKKKERDAKKKKGRALVEVNCESESEFVVNHLNFSNDLLSDNVV
ncbi:hypothetical protein OSB04_018513 [Centaurea solstitialis]|uniref:Ribosomal eL28/Mak16 domain-containing protein n=1 Tax=Centaurea solstitialis TaxID=347529 RepID=A0AA38TPX1_9ASTR|nr:hypothetical protein OSB04_018513 [Centaurea solstitialis]